MRVLLTGGNRGIGLEVAARIAELGHEVVVTVRSEEKGQRARDAIRARAPDAPVESGVLDLASFHSVRAFVGGLPTDEPFGVVIHNAGIIFAAPDRRLTGDGVEECLQVHGVSPLLLTALVAERCGFPGRVVAVSSPLHEPGGFGPGVDFDFDDPHLGREGRYHRKRAYGNAKLAQLWFVLEWERRFGDVGSRGDAICPGFVPTTAAESASGLRRILLRWILPPLPFTRSAGEAGEIVTRWAVRSPEEGGGVFFDGKRIREPSEEAASVERARRFWRMASRWTGYDFAELAVG